MQLLARGVLYGLLAALLVIPWMMTASILFQAVLKALDVQMDAMHELIRAIRDHPETQLILWGLFSATILAPLAEEVLFRGVLQTALVTAWARIFEPHAPEEGRGFDVVMPVVPIGSPSSMSSTWAGSAAPMTLPAALAQPGATATATHPLGYSTLPASPPTLAASPTARRLATVWRNRHSPKSGDFGHDHVAGHARCAIQSQELGAPRMLPRCPAFPATRRR